jgi:hypothetical protein
MQMNNKRTCNRTQEPIDHDISLYEIIELNESEPIIFQRDKRKQQLCKPVNSENNKQVILVIPTN